MKTVFLPFLLAAAAAAQTPGTVAGPLLGMVFENATGQVRPLMGLSVSSRLGAALDSGPALAVAAASETFAVGVQSGDGAAVLVTAGGRTPLTGVPAGADQVALSPNGAAAVFYFAQSRTAWLLRGLPGNPQVAGQVVTGGQPTRMAVSDDAAALLTVEPTGRDRMDLISYADGQPAVTRWFGPHIRAVQFNPDSRNALLVTPESVVMLADGSGTQVLADKHNGITDAVAAAASRDGSHVFMALESGQVVVLDLQSQTQSSVACACRPATLARLRGNAVFRLSDAADAPLWLLDADGAAPRILFVAAGAE